MSTISSRDSLNSNGVDIKGVFADVPTTIAALSAIVDGEPHLMVASSFTVGVSFNPPMISVAVQHTSSTWPTLSHAPVIGVSVLAEDHAPHVRQLGSRDRANRLQGIPYSCTESGAVFLDSGHTLFECEVEKIVPAGDHDIVLLRVLRFTTHEESEALVWSSARWSAK